MRVLNDKTEQIEIFQSGKKKTKYLENNLNLFFSFLHIKTAVAQLNKLNEINTGA